MQARSTQLSPPIALSFAASDPLGGAGIQADSMTLSSMDCHALSVITALTGQDTVDIESVPAIDAEWVEAQARARHEDMPVDVFKIGLLGNVDNIAVIAGIFSDYPDMPRVFDPVLASGRGDGLPADDMISAIRQTLLPQSTILAPNSLEVRRPAVAGHEDENELTLDECARRAEEDSDA